jgi:hypothetical protein
MQGTADSKTLRGEMLCVWTGLFAILLFICAWVIFYRWLMPPLPGLSPDDVAAIYQLNTFGIRIGNVIMTNFAAPLTVSFAAIITVYILRMKGVSPALAWTQLASGAVNALIFIIPSSIYGAVAFRPERPSEILSFGHDMGWLIFDFVVGPTQVQWMAIALAILFDQSERPLMPRWFAYFCIWASLVIFANNGVIFFSDGGPFSWNGLLGWWLGASTFCLWYLVAFYVMRRAVLLHRNERS